MSSPLTHLQLVPADNITASYDNEAKMLILTANGTQVDITRDIYFQRLPFAGGLLFALQGFVGPIIQGDSPYSVTNGFNIELPNPVTPSNTVVINTENKQGWVIPIQGLQQNGATAANGKSSSGVPELKDTVGDQKIVAGLGQPFTIKQSDSFKGQGGTVDIAFDKRFVTLTDASIRDGNIEWTFTSLQTGATELAVYVGQTNPPFMYREVYVASIVPPNSNSQVNPTVSFAVSSPKATNGTNGSKVSAAKNATKDGLPLSWDGFVNIGINLIKKQQPDAQLYEIDATPATTEPVANEWGLVNNRIVATLPANKTAIIQSNGWGSFGPVQIIDGPFLDDQVISWPVSLDIHDAFTILRNASYKELVGAVTLRKPLYPGIDQPFYIFNVGQEFIGVGVQDKKIHNFGPTGREIQQSK